MGEPIQRVITALIIAGIVGVFGFQFATSNQLAVLTGKIEAIPGQLAQRDQRLDLQLAVASQSTEIELTRLAAQVGRLQIHADKLASDMDQVWPRLRASGQREQLLASEYRQLCESFNRISGAAPMICDLELPAPETF